MGQGSRISILDYEHGERVKDLSILVYEHVVDRITDLHPRLPLQNVALKRHRTKNHTSLIEKSIDLKII